MTEEKGPACHGIMAKARNECMKAFKTTFSMYEISLWRTPDTWMAPPQRNQSTNFLLLSNSIP